MSKWMQDSGWLVLVLATMVGCSPSEPSSTTTSATSPAAAPDTTYLMMEPPGIAQGVGAAFKGTEEEITVVGLIGGSQEPFVADLAAFTIVDPSIPYCSKDEGWRPPLVARGHSRPARCLTSWI